MLLFLKETGGAESEKGRAEGRQDGIEGPMADAGVRLRARLHACVHTRVRMWQMYICNCAAGFAPLAVGVALGPPWPWPFFPAPGGGAVLSLRLLPLWSVQGGHRLMQCLWVSPRGHGPIQESRWADRVQVGLPPSPASLATASTTVRKALVQPASPGRTFGQLLVMSTVPSRTGELVQRHECWSKTPRALGHRKHTF